MKNVTLSIPDDLLQKSREYAQKHGSSLNEFVRVLLKQAINQPENDPVQKLIVHSRTKRLVVETKTRNWKRSELPDH